MRLYIITCFLLLAISCGQKSTTEQNEAKVEENIITLTDKQLQSFELTTTSILQKNISNTLKLNGRVEVPPQGMATISHPLGGYIKSTKLIPGMHFKKGDIIAVLEDNQYIQLQQDYLTTKAQIQSAESEYLRQKELNISKASSDKTYEQAKMQFETLQITKKALEQKLRLININPNNINLNNIQRIVNVYAPFDGYTTKVMVHIGKYISPSDVLFEIINPNQLLLNLKVFEKDWDKIKANQTVTAYTNNDTSRKYIAKVVLIGKNITDETAMEVHAKFSTIAPDLIPGLYMNAELELPNYYTNSLPESCIQTYEGAQYIFIKKTANTFEMQKVKTGISGNGWVEVILPQNIIDKVIVEKGAYTLLMALKNKIEE